MEGFTQNRPGLNKEKGEKKASKAYEKFKSILAAGLMSVSLNMRATEQAVLETPKISMDNPQRAYMTDPESDYYKNILKTINAERASSVICLQEVLDELEKTLVKDEAVEKPAVIENMKQDIRNLKAAIIDLEKKLTISDIFGIKFEGKKLYWPEDIAKALRKIDEKREWFVRKLHSYAYEKKAMEKEGMSKEQVEERRRRSLADVRVAIVGDPVLEGNIGIYHSEEDKVTTGIGELQTYEEEAENNLGTHYEDLTNVIHEKEHQITRGNTLLSEVARKLYQKAYVKIGDETEDAYLGRSTELDARKKVFEFDLERYKIWKYGEPFTADTLKKVMELKKKKMLSRDSETFLDRIKKNMIIKIMNTIAGVKTSDIDTRQV